MVGKLRVLVSAVLFLAVVTCAPVQFTSRSKGNSVFGNVSSEKLITFMQTFGYLQEPASDSEGLKAEFLYAEDAVVKGIKNIQKFGALAETGVLDDQTVELLSSPRCGVKDVTNERERRKRYIIGSKNWEKRQITYFIANWSPKVDEAKMVEWVEEAFNAWALYSRLKFKRVFNATADIIIAFGSYYHGDRYPFDGPGNILAHAFYPYEENAFGGDIHFDNEENWKENATTMNEGVDFLTVLTHELGHSLGLAHSPVYSSLMFPYYKGLTRAQLDYDDILAMYSLYITRPLKENGDDEAGDQGNDESKSSESSDESTTIAVKREKEELPTDGASGDKDHHDENETQEPEAVPDICEGSFDAVSYLRESVFIFKGSFIWQFNSNFELEDDFPKKIDKVFPNLPKRFKRIDAVYQILDEDEIVFFSGSEYITYDIRGPIYTAYNITRYTYDEEIEKIDAAMVWEKNNKTYLFSSDRYWKYSDNRMMNPFYPRVMTRWNGVPENLDAAVSIPNGKTIFFKGNQFWEFDSKKVRPKKGSPRSIVDLIDYCLD